MIKASGAQVIKISTDLGGAAVNGGEDLPRPAAGPGELVVNNGNVFS